MVLSLSGRATALIFVNHPLHELDVVVLGQVTVLAQVRAFVRRHCFQEVFDNVVGDERVAEVNFRHVRLENGTVSDLCRESDRKGKWKAERGEQGDGDED